MIGAAIRPPSPHKTQRCRKRGKSPHTLFDPILGDLYAFFKIAGAGWAGGVAGRLGAGSEKYALIA